MISDLRFEISQFGPARGGTAPGGLRLRVPTLPGCSKTVKFSAMSRFNNLEFGNESDEQTRLQKPAIKGEAHYLAEARAAFENANFELALRLYSKVLEFNPDNAAAWTGQVRMLIELGEFREAKLWADKALERFPQEPELLAAKAAALARTGDLQGALVFSDADIEERGDTPYLW